MSVSPIISGASPQAAEQLGELTRTARAKSTAFNAAALRQAAPSEQSAAVSAQFEAILVRQLLGKTLNSMLGGEGGGVSGSIYGDMLADTISQQLTAGPGLGLGRFIQQQLSPRAPRADSQSTDATGRETPDLTNPSAVGASLNAAPRPIP